MANSVFKKNTNEIFASSKLKVLTIPFTVTKSSGTVSSYRAVSTCFYEGFLVSFYISYQNFCILVQEAIRGNQILGGPDT